jgi:hypothetical protein
VRVVDVFVMIYFGVGLMSCVEGIGLRCAILSRLFKFPGCGGWLAANRFLPAGESKCREICLWRLPGFVFYDLAA